MRQLLTRHWDSAENTTEDTTSPVLSESAGLSADATKAARRAFIKGGLGVAGFAAASSVLAACSGSDNDSAETAAADAAPADPSKPEIEWDMALSWPATLDALFGSSRFFAEKVGELTGGRFKINLRPAGELVGSLEVLPAVRDLKTEIGHTPSYYYTELSPVHLFGTTVPFGLTQRQQNAWLYHGGGLEMLNDFYSETHDIIAFPAGGTGCQMGGWFTKEVNTVDDLRGLRMRIPGLAGGVFKNLGAEPVELSIGEILPAIQNGEIDAAEFTGPADDLALGLDQFKGDLYYYYPGWWEPGPVSDVLISLERWNELPEQYQAAVKAAAMSTNLNAVAHYDVHNAEHLPDVRKFAHIREFPPELMAIFKAETEKMLDTAAADDKRFASILNQWRQFRDSITEWHSLAERSYISQQSTPA